MWRLTFPFFAFFLMGFTHAVAHDGCGQNKCCCGYTNSIGGTSYVCTVESINECDDAYGGTCGNMGKCPLPRKRSSSFELHNSKRPAATFIAHFPRVDDLLP